MSNHGHLRLRHSNTGEIVHRIHAFHFNHLVVLIARYGSMLLVIETGYWVLHAVIVCKMAQDVFLNTRIVRRARVGCLWVIALLHSGKIHVERRHRWWGLHHRWVVFERHFHLQRVVLLHVHSHRGCCVLPYFFRFLVRWGRRALGFHIACIVVREHHGAFRPLGVQIGRIAQLVRVHELFLQRFRDGDGAVGPKTHYAVWPGGTTGRYGELGHVAKPSVCFLRCHCALKCEIINGRVSWA